MRVHTINFQAQFAELVASGEKRQTIRAPRKRPISVGDELRLYTGMRTKACRLLGVATCTSVEKIAIEPQGSAMLGVRLLDATRARTLARADGFGCWSDLFDWFDRVQGLPFEGVVIRWGALR